MTADAPARPNGDRPATDVRPLVEHFFRHEHGRVAATLARTFGFAHLDLIEDVVQEALLKALDTWPFHGIPENPSAWVISVAKNKARDALRRESAWIDRVPDVQRSTKAHQESPDDDVGYASEVTDDQLRLIFSCCHPVISADDRVALTLKIVGGFSTSEIARAFLVRESSMAQRLVRAKRKLRETGVDMEMPPTDQLDARIDSVLDVLYLMFNEGYGATEGEHLIRRDLCQEAIRLGELVAEHPLVGWPKAHALVALMLFQAARFDTRVGPEGEAVVLAEQDRTSWDRAMISRGMRHLEQAARGDDLSELHLQAEIAAHHATADRFEETNWQRILDCYDRLVAMNPSPVIAVNRAVALAEVESPEAALASLEPIAEMEGYYPWHAVRGALLHRLGRSADAREQYRLALSASVPQPVRRVIEERLASLR